MHRKLIGIPLAGLLLIGGATAALAASDEDGDSPVSAVAGRVGGLLEEVLGDLVDDGTLTQDQADAVAEAVTEKRETRRAERQATREQLREFFSDGVLSADELAQLPEDHPIRQLEDALEDGQITTEELQELRPFRGHRHGPGFQPAPGTEGDTDAAPAINL